MSDRTCRERRRERAETAAASPASRRAASSSLTGAGISAESGVPTFRGPGRPLAAVPARGPGHSGSLRPRSASRLGVVRLAPGDDRAAPAQRRPRRPRPLEERTPGVPAGHPERGRPARGGGQPPPGRAARQRSGACAARRAARSEDDRRVPLPEPPSALRLRCAAAARRRLVRRGAARGGGDAGFRRRRGPPTSSS